MRKIQSSQSHQLTSELLALYLINVAIVTSIKSCKVLVRRSPTNESEAKASKQTKRKKKSYQ